MTVNPSLIGKNVIDWRAMANYRSQWYGLATAYPFVTSTLTIEKRIAIEKAGENQLAVGAMFLTDQSNAGLLKNNFFSLGLAYNNALDASGAQLLGAGLSVSYHNRILDPSKFIFQSQFGSNGYQPGIGVLDGVNITKNSYFDLNAGLSYSEKRKTMGFNLGISYYHAGGPKDGAYSPDQHLLYPRVSVQGGLQFYLKSKDEWHFSLLTNTQGAGNNIPDLVTLGTVYKINVNANAKGLNKFNIGVWERFNAATVAYIGLESANNWLLGVTYDFILTDLKSAYSNVKSMEFSFAWQFAGKSKKATIPQAASILMY
jgi:type IX secretion system PorP/SprF family membrane protein